MSSSLTRFNAIAGLAIFFSAITIAKPGSAAVKVIGDFEANMASPYSNPSPVIWQLLNNDPDFVRLIDKTNPADAAFAAGVTHGNGAILVTHPQQWSGGPYLRLNAGAPLLDDTATYPYLMYDVTTFGGPTTPDEGPTYRQIFNIFNGPTVSGAYNYPGFCDGGCDPDFQNTLNRGDGRDEIAGFGDGAFTFTQVVDLTAPDPGTFPAPADGKLPINIKSQQLRADNTDGTPLDPFYWQLYFAFQGDDSPQTPKVQIVLDNIRFCTVNDPASCQAATGVLGDYNGNGTVDAADYVAWRKGGALQHEVADPGTVSPADYTEWRARFGNTAGSGTSLGASANVPEPASWLLLLTCTVIWPVRLRVTR